MGGGAPVESGPGRLGHLLRGYRERAALTQEEVATRAGLTVHAVSALERGTRTRPYPHTLRSLADALDLAGDDRAALLASVPRRGAQARSVATDDREPPRRGGAGGGSAAAPDPHARLAGAAPAGPALTSPATPLVGRARDVAELTALVTRPGTRLLTLTGPGGVGKTRLAVAVATVAASAFADGVAEVALAPIRDPALVVPAIGRALGLRQVEGLDAEQVVADHLRPLETLLVLDNAEHLLEAAADVARLVEACPRLTVLVSSRAPLRVRSETEWPVEPLSLPEPWPTVTALDDGGPPPPGAEQVSAEQVSASAAGTLFLERAQAVRPGFALTPGNAPAVGAICHQLAGIPLALELAAAKLRVLDPASLLERLDSALAAGSARDLPERQRTMRATLDWSLGLLTEPEQALFRRLAVFTGGFTLEAAEALAGPRVAAPDVLGLLERLVDQSLVVAGADVWGVRYRLLEPVAQYAATLLAQHGEADDAHRDHALFFLGLAERAAPAYECGDQVEWLSRTDADHGNHAAALAWALGSDDPDLAARHGWALWLYWWLRGHLREGRRAMESALARELSPGARIGAALTAAAMTFAQGDYAASAPLWQLALDLAVATRDEPDQAHAVAGTGIIEMALGRPESAAEHLRRAIALSEVHGMDWLHSLTNVWLGTTLLVGGEVEGAVRRVQAGLDSARARGDRLVSYIALFTLSQAALARGDLAAATRLLEEGVALSQQTADSANLAYLLDALAVLEGLRGRHERVASLVGAAQALRDEVGSAVYGYYMTDGSSAVRAAEGALAALGEAAYGDAVDRGRALGFGEAVGFALGADLLSA